MSSNFVLVERSVCWLQSCKSGRDFRAWPVAGLILSKCFGPIAGLHTIFLQMRILFSPVTVEAIELIKSSIKND